MDDKDIEMLLAIQRTQSITHAAELLFINQSSLSKRLQQLERQLSTKLVIRTNQGIHFTSAGRSALKTAKQIKRLNNELKESLSVDDSEFSGTLNLGCSIDYAQYELPDLLVAFQTKYPQIQLNITIDYSRSILQKLLTDDSVNVGIIRGEFKGPLKKVPIVTEGINLICQTPEDSQRLSDLPYIQRKSDDHFQAEMTDWLIQQQLSILNHQTILVNNLTSCVEFVRRGLGWAIVPEIALNHFSGYREPLTLHNQPFTRTTYLMAQAKTMKQPVVNAFYEILKQRYLNM